MSSPISEISKGDDAYDEKLGTSSFHSDAVKYDSGVDVAVNLVAGAHADDAALSPEEFRRIRAKLDWHILPLLFLIYTLQALDKSTIGASAILGLIKDNNLTSNQFNNLGSAFYIGYLLFEYPQNLALQRFPVARWLSINIFVWSILMVLHVACKNYGGLFTLRILLGASEGCVTAAVMIIASMFYTRTEIGERIGWTQQCNGIAQIVSGFMAFGVYHVNPEGHPNQWQWLMISVSVLTFITGVLFMWRFPNNPPTARFLNQMDKIKTIKRTRANQNGIETKVWKKSQFIEALKDPKTWLFFLFAAVAYAIHVEQSMINLNLWVPLTFSDLQNGLSTQYSLIIQSFGFNTLQTTLLNIPSGCTQIIGITTFGLLLRRFPNSRSWLAILAFVPSTLGATLLITLPWSNRVGLLCSYYVLNLGGAPGFALCIAWVASTTAGHTKKLTTNAIFMIGYALGQILSTQPWHPKYRPRNYVPWSICLASYAGDFIILYTLRVYLQRENKRRDAAQAARGVEDDEFGYVERIDEDGKPYQQKVEKAFLDLTDRENQSFRYCL